MHTIGHHLRRLGAALTIAALAIAAVLAGGQAAQARLASAAPAPATCTLSGTTRSCGLWARTGSLTLGGGSVPIWGYSDSAAGAAQLPGPVLIVNQGETLELTLTNVDLPQNTALNIQALDGAPDLTGVAAGGSRTYTFANLTPGTYLYEAGLTADAARQAAMGLHGALIVRPAANASQAYAGAATAFDDEAVLVYSEIDPAFNASPLTYAFQNYKPAYRLINGAAFPNTATIAAAAGDKVLLRQVNAGMHHHTVSLLGARQTIVGRGSVEASYPQRVVAESLAAGETLDTLVSIPATAADGTKYAVYDAALSGSGASGLNGMGGLLTFITVSGAASGGDTTGPAVSGVTLNPAFTNGGGTIALSATLSDPSNVAAAEYSIDGPAAAGSGTAMTGAFGTATVAASASFPASGLSSGTHTIYVRGQDGAGNWGAVASAVLTVDTTGPAVSAIILTPKTTSGGAIGIQATASDVGRGGSAVTDAEFFIGAPGANGSGAALTLNQQAATVALTGSASAAPPEGSYTISIHAKDAAGNWGPFATASYTVDTTGPATSGITVRPSPNNGGTAFNSTTNGVRVDATLTDPTSGGVQSAIGGGEVFVDTLGTAGSGLLLQATDGVFNATGETAYAVIPMSKVSVLAEGSHTIYVRGRDAAGNWGAAAQSSLVIDKTAPTLGAVALSPNPTNGAASVAISATATDANGATAAEYFIGADPGKGSGTALTVGAGGAISGSADVSALASGSYTVSVRARDAAGNWSATSSATLTVQQPVVTLFANSFASATLPSGWTGTGGTAARLALTSAANMADANTYGLAATISGGTSGYVYYNLPTAETTYRARFLFNPNNAAIGTGAQDIFTGRNGNTVVFRVQVRRANGSYQVRYGVLRSGGQTFTGWYGISANAANTIEITWQSSASASASLSTGGTLRQTLNGLNTSANVLRVIRLGPQSSLGNGASGTEYFDGFASTRN